MVTPVLIRRHERDTRPLVGNDDGPPSGVVGSGQRADTCGLNDAAKPASDFIGGTPRLAAGMKLPVFTAGRGTP